MLVVAVAIALGQSKAQKPAVALTSAEVIKKMRATVRSGSPVTGSLETKGPSGQMVSMTFKIMHPALMSAKVSMFGMQSEIYWTKSWFFNYLPETKVYVKLPRPANPVAFDVGLAGLESLFNDHNYYSGIGSVSKVQFAGKQALSIPLTRSLADTGSARKYVLFVDAKTHLPLGFDQDDPGAGGVDRSTYKTLTLRAKLTAKDFEWTPPNGATSATDG